MNARPFFVLALALLNVALQAGPANSAAAVRPLAVGSAAPSVVVQGVDGESFDLGAAVRKQPTVLIFYRGGWCPYCNVHLGALQELEPQLKALGFQILAVSTDAPAGLAPTAQKHGLAYQLLSDREMKAADAYGVAFKVPPNMYEGYASRGIELAPVPGEPSEHWLPVPSVFIVGRDGSIRFAHSDPDFKKRLDRATLLKAATDENKPR